MPLNEAYDYLNHHRVPDMENPQMNRQVFREIDYFCHTYNLVPKVYLSYERRAYFEKTTGISVLHLTKISQPAGKMSG